MRKFAIIILVTSTAWPVNLFPFAFIFAGSAYGLDVVTHPIGYSGIGGHLTLTVGIDQTSANATAMEIPTQNVVNTINALMGQNQNMATGVSNNVPFSEYDYESVLLHEMGHSLGLSHVNAATESGLPSNQRNYTKCEEGNNSVFDLNAGADGIIGSKDDIRGDDINLNYFKILDNSPFSSSGTFDASTYSRNINDLPSGHNFSENADRSVAAASPHFLSNTECIMQQGTFNGEAQRLMGFDDLAGLRYAMSGLDEIQGTSDDYTFELSFVGQVSNADILIDFDTQTGFAVSQSGGTFLGGSGHVAITSNSIYFNPNVVTWFFNPISNATSPCNSANTTNVLQGDIALNAVLNDGHITSGAMGAGKVSVNANNVTFLAVNTITLNPEFEVVAPNVFTAEIGPCP